MNKIISIKDIVDIESFQKIQNDIAKATGVAIIATDYRGRPITNHSLCTEFCSIIRSDPKLKELCERCDSRGGLEAARTEKPYIYICHKGLVDFAIPIIVNEQYLGSLMSGQILTHDIDIKNLEKIIQIDNDDIKENKVLMEAYKKLNVISLEKIKTIANMMFHIANYIVQEGNLKLIKEEVKRKNDEIIQSSENQTKLTRKLNKLMLKEGTAHISYEFIFDVINLVSSLSLIEGSYKTHKILGEFSKILRYNLEKENKVVMLDEELDYAYLYLNMYKMRYGDRLDFKINNDDTNKKLKIPSMIIYMFIENIIMITLKNNNNKVSIKIEVIENKNDSSIIMSFDEIHINKVEKLDINSEMNYFRESVDNVKRKMNRFYGGDYGIEIHNKKDEGINIVIKFLNN